MSLITYLQDSLGYPDSLLPRKLRLISRLLEKFFSLLPNRKPLLYRIPCRVNLMGMHIEHRGGYVNHISLPRETFFAVTRGNRGEINFHNIDPSFPSRRYHIEEYLPPLREKEWLDFLDSIPLKKGDWGNYLLGALLRLGKDFSLEKMSGVQGVIGGDIPQGSGLSSSSTLVVGTLLSITEIASLPLSRERLTEIAGEAEWFVGTRGGAGDHGAMLLGKKGKILHLRFFPLIYEYLDFPENLTILVAHSGKKAEKSKGARDIFNERIATYDLALTWLKKKHPSWRDRIKWVRDVNPLNLGLKEEEIYNLLKELPLRADRETLRKELGEEILPLFTTHREPPEGYRLREVLLYGISECQRAEKLANLSRKGNWEKIGKLMYIAHDGDRVSRRGEEYLPALTDETLDRFYREKIPLEEVPGSYSCSIPELDEMVDLVKESPRVLGARLTGAGLGGSIVILLEKGGEEEVKKILLKGYYEKKGIPPLLIEGYPVEGAGKI